MNWSDGNGWALGIRWGDTSALKNLWGSCYRYYWRRPINNKCVLGIVWFGERTFCLALPEINEQVNGR